MKQPIPDAALDDRLGFTGTSGSGKTYTAMGRVERLLDKAARVCVIDPLGVWWGLRVEHDRKTPSRFATAPEGSAKRVVIFGGTHGDLPLTELSGKLVGETVAGMAESCILDLSEIGTAAGERRFLLAFLTSLYRKTSKEPRHLVVDEADMFAPQKVLDKEGDANKLLGMMQTVVRRGRVKGFIPWLITQRPAEISKGVLSQVDGLSIGKLTASQDIAAIGAWVKATADEGVWEKTKGELPSFGIGQSMVWIPGRGIIGTYQFPEKSTFDSSRAPKRGETIKQTNLKPLDLGKLQQLLATVEAEAKANDPRALKEELAKTKRELAAALKKPAAPIVDQRAIEAAQQKAFREGWDGAMSMSQQVFDGLKRVVDDAYAHIERNVREKLKPITQLKFTATKAPKLEIQKPGSPAAPMAVNTPEPNRPVHQSRPRQEPSSVKAKGDGSLTNPQAELMRAIAWWAAMGHDQPTKSQVAAIVGWKVSGSNLRNRLADLSGMGLIHYPQSGRISFTKEGFTASPAPDTSRTLIDSIKSMLTGPQNNLFDAIREVAHPAATKEELGAKLGWEAGGSNLRNRLADLSGMEIIHYPSKGLVALQDWVQ